MPECAACGNTEEFEEQDSETLMCLACGEDIPLLKGLLKVGVVRNIEEMREKSKGKALRLVTVSFTEEEEEEDNKDEEEESEKHVRIVTNAKVSLGERVIAALPGQRLPVGSSNEPDNDSSFVVSKKVVGGKPSGGVLCDAPALGWQGAAGVLPRLPADLKAGTAPPMEKPRS